MHFIIGGTANGKYERLLQLGFQEEDIFDCEREGYTQAFARPVIYKLHTLVGLLLAQGVEPLEYIMEHLEKAKVQVIVCDEVGAGVVPAQPAERAYREAVGRISCAVAAKADIVERVYCGISTVIKGNAT